MAFADFLALPVAPRCWLLEVDAVSLDPISDGSTASGSFSDFAFGEATFGEGDGIEASGIETLSWSTHGFTSKATDTPPNLHYEARLEPDIEIARRLYGVDGIAGLARVTARARLINADGGLDELLDHYAVDGRPARLLLGHPDEDARADFGTVAVCIVQAASAGIHELELELSDGLARLDVPLNIMKYAGTGGLESGADLAGKPKPKCYGRVYNVTPPLVDSVKLIYQVNDGAINDVSMVYDRGIELVKGADYASQAELESVAPAAGNFRVWKGGGYFRLGSAPAGQVTADVLGDATDTGYVDTHADIIERILRFQVALDAAELEADSFDELNVDVPAEAGIWRGAEPSTARDAVAELLVSCGAFGGFDFMGMFHVAQVKAPSGAPAASYDDTQIGAITRVALPPDAHPIVWRTLVAWQRNWTVQADLAAGVTAARRAFAAQAERVAPRQDLALKSRRPLAREYGPTRNLFAQQADADTEAARRLALWGAKRSMYRVTLLAIALTRDCGEVVNIKHPRLGFAAGRDARILGHALNGTDVELTVLA